MFYLQAEQSFNKALAIDTSLNTLVEVQRSINRLQGLITNQLVNFNKTEELQGQQISNIQDSAFEKRNCSVCNNTEGRARTLQRSASISSSRLSGMKRKIFIMLI